jgi:maltooligosyltrehalose trehalohydrolase
LDEAKVYRIGAVPDNNGNCRFLVWAPKASQVDVHIVAPEERIAALQAGPHGYHVGSIAGLGLGARYFLRLDGGAEYPDPASRYQPMGVHGPSEIISPDFPWNDNSWRGIPLRRYIIYELHVGTFSPEGTFEAAIPYIDRLVDLGITAVEMMPVGQFPGGRNWGYDGVYQYAAQSTYGGPVGLKRFVDACHSRGLAVVLDVVYNHFGPEGNYLGCFGPYFTDRYRTPWGQPLNFDGPASDEVRRFFIENAMTWLRDFHIDALRLDALHAIYDFSAHTFLEDLADAKRDLQDALDRRIFLIGESDDNKRRLITEREFGGYGIDAQWNDGFHHSLRTLLTGERDGYYADYGKTEQMAKAFRDGFVYDGRYSPFRGRHHGSPSRDIPADRFVVFSQNHDQIGNRMMGDRLSATVSFDSLRLAAASVLLAPAVPLLFMGEEYGEQRPFQYFTSHSDPALAEAVHRGRKEEFAAFSTTGEPPDPQAESTFLQSKLDHELARQGNHRLLLSFYKELIRLRSSIPALSNLSRDEQEVMCYEKQKVVFVRRWHDHSEAALVLSFGDHATMLDIPLPSGRWRTVLDSTGEVWGGGGSWRTEEVVCGGHWRPNIPPRSALLIERFVP